MIPQKRQKVKRTADFSKTSFFFCCSFQRFCLFPVSGKGLCAGKKSAQPLHLRVCPQSLGILLQFHLTHRPLCLVPFRQLQGQYAIFKGTCDPVGFYLGNIKASGEGTVAPLSAQIPVLFIFIALFLFAGCGHGQNILDRKSVV